MFHHVDFAKSFFSKNSNKRHLCTDQMKLWFTDTNFGDEFAEAIESTSGGNLYTNKTSGEIFQDWREEVVADLKR